MKHASSVRLSGVMAALLLAPLATLSACGKDDPKPTAGKKAAKRVVSKKKAQPKEAPPRDEGATTAKGAAAPEAATPTLAAEEGDEARGAAKTAPAAAVNPAAARATEGAAAADNPPADHPAGGPAPTDEPGEDRVAEAAPSGLPAGALAAAPLAPGAESAAAPDADLAGVAPTAPGDALAAEVAAAPPTPAAAPDRRKARGADAGPPLDITGYLSIADLERVLAKKGKFRRAPLSGVPPSSSHNSLYYADASGKDFGVSVQVWHDRNLVDSRARYNTMRATYSDVVETNRVTAQGFRAFYGGVVTLVFADARRPLVAAVSCSTRFCDADAVIELSRRVAGRMR